MCFVLLWIFNLSNVLAIEVAASEPWYPWWINYPGLELWKFINLFLFIGVALYLHYRFGRPVREALRSRGERIKAELLQAQAERDQALAKLAEVESRFANLDAEIAKVRQKVEAEATAEKERIAAATEAEIAKTREQAKREIESAGKAARQELRRFAAAESVRLAEGLLEREIKVEDDVRLTTLSVEELGRAQS
jgi:F-type H+-transporting ATPase subunit b